MDTGEKVAAVPPDQPAPAGDPSAATSPEPAVGPEGEQPGTGDGTGVVQDERDAEYVARALARLSVKDVESLVRRLDHPDARLLAGLLGNRNLNLRKVPRQLLGRIQALPQEQWDPFLATIVQPCVYSFVVSLGENHEKPTFEELTRATETVRHREGDVVVELTLAMVALLGWNAAVAARQVLGYGEPVAPA